MTSKRSGALGVDREVVSLRSTNQQQEPGTRIQPTTRDRPILFSGEMVRAILDGRKSQTRRVGSMRGADRVYWHVGETHRWGEKPPQRYEGWAAEVDRLNGLLLPLRCPFGQPGDRLWVRESWGTVRMHELGQHIYGGPRIPDREEVVYRAGKVMGIPVPGTSPIQFTREWRDDFQPARWRPSIQLPWRLTVNLLLISEAAVGRTTSWFIPNPASAFPIF